MLCAWFKTHMTKTKATADRVVLFYTKREQCMSSIYYKSDTFWPIFKARNQNNTVIPAAGTDFSKKWKFIKFSVVHHVRRWGFQSHRPLPNRTQGHSQGIAQSKYAFHHHPFHYTVLPLGPGTCRPYDPPPSALIRGVSEISRICLESKSMTPRRGRYCSF